MGTRNKYRLFSSGVNLGVNPAVNIVKGNTYIFDLSDASNLNRNLRFSQGYNGLHGGMAIYNTGVTIVGTPGTSGAYVQLEVAQNVPNLYYFCVEVSNMSGAIPASAGVGGSCQQESDLAFEEWIPLENNGYVGRSFQFKAVLSTEHLDQTPLVDQLGVSVQFARRTENSATLISGTSASGKAVTFDKAFYTDNDTKVTGGIVAFGLGAGDYYVMSEPTGSGFTITFKNGTRVINRDFQYTAIGYGTQQA